MPLVSFGRALLASFVLSIITCIVANLDPIIVKGYKFFDSGTGEEFVVRGVDYYPRPNFGDNNHNSLDLFTDEQSHAWKRDISYLKDLGVNAIRLYAVNASLDHDNFMCALEEAGIYVIVALAHDCPTCAVTRDPSPLCYPVELKIQGQAVIRAFSKYSNTLAFSAGNEVNHFAPPSYPSWNAACQKKFLKDMRQYMASCAAENDFVRQIPIGLVSADDYREDLAQYYNCREDLGADGVYDAAEWYGLNSYVSCDGNVTAYDGAGGFKLLQRSFDKMNYSIPVLLTEFGCLSNSFPTVDGYEGQRNFLEAEWFLTEHSLRDQFCGGFAFEYSTESANAQSPYPFKSFGPQSYGLGYFSPERCDDIHLYCEYNPTPAFYNLKKIYKETKVSYVIHRDEFIVPLSRQKHSACPSGYPPMSSFSWKADTVDSIACPSISKKFTCRGTKDFNFFHPKPTPPVTVNDVTGKGDIDNGNHRTMLLLQLGMAVLVVVILVSIFLLFHRHSTGDPFRAFLSPSSPPGDGMRSDQSEESEGLLSLKHYEEGGTYQAIGSDSSLEGMEETTTRNSV